MLTQEDFYEKAQKFALFTDTDNKHYTFEEYQTLIKDNQTDKDGNLIYCMLIIKMNNSVISSCHQQGIQCSAYGWSIRCSYGKYAGTEV